LLVRFPSVILADTAFFLNAFTGKDFLGVYMILGLGIPELLIIVVAVMVIFGPKNLPKLGKAVGETVKSVREGMESETKEEAKEPEAELVEDEESKKAE
jgi:sec-independent protein translocase protein tatA/E homolog